MGEEGPPPGGWADFLRARGAFRVEFPPGSGRPGAPGLRIDGTVTRQGDEPELARATPPGGRPQLARSSPDSRAPPAPARMACARAAARDPRASSPARGGRHRPAVRKSSRPRSLRSMHTHVGKRLIKRLALMHWRRSWRRGTRWRWRRAGTEGMRTAALARPAYSRFPSCRSGSRQGLRWQAPAPWPRFFLCNL